METRSHAPSFTVSLRGYDRMEVDDYLDSLAEALGQVELARRTSADLQAEVERLRARVAELEERIRTESPRSGAALGERIGLLLQDAERAAAEALGRAEAEAEALLRSARAEVATAEDAARATTARAEEQARRLEAAARAEADEIRAEAEARAVARTRQIEQWAEQVMHQTRAQEAQMLAAQAAQRARAEADVQAIVDRRDAVAATLHELRAGLGQALGLIDADAEGSQTSPEVPERSGVEPASAPAGETAPLTPIAADDADDADPGTRAAAGGSTSTDPADPEPAAVQGGEATTPAVVTSPGGGAAGSRETASAPPAEADRDAVASPAQPSTTDDDERPWPTSFDPFADAADDQVGAEDTKVAGVMLGDGDDRDFDSRFEAWVSGTTGPRHFRSRF